jgi:hypothetical protein
MLMMRRLTAVTGGVARDRQIRNLCAALRSECLRRGLHRPGALFHLERRFDKGGREAGLQMPLDVACEACRSARVWRAREKRDYTQWNIHAPGLSAIRRSVTEDPAGTWTVSRRIGFSWPSTTDGLSVGSLEV